MKTITIAALAVTSILGTGIVHAQSVSDPIQTTNQRRIHPHREQVRLIDTQRLTTESESSVATTRARMGLNAQQDKLWEPVASALRDLGQLRINHANARMESVSPQSSTRQSARDRRNGAAADADTLLRQRADIAAAESKALTAVADAAAPLSQTLNPRQKRLLSSLIRHETSWRHPVLAQASQGHPVLGQHPVLRHHPVLGNPEAARQQTDLGN